MAFIAIQTKFLGPTNFRGSRIKATAMDSYSDERVLSVTIGYDHALNGDANHRVAAEKLLPKVVRNPEDVHMVAGAWKRGYVFVAVHNAHPMQP
jgi:hypothetical protein